MKLLLLSFILISVIKTGFSQDLESFVARFKSANDGGLYVKISKTRMGDYFLEIASKESYRVPIYYGFVFREKGKVFCIINHITINQYINDSVYYNKKIAYDNLRNGESKIELSIKDKILILDGWSGESCRFCYSYTQVSKQNMPIATFEPKPDDVLRAAIVSFKKNGYFRSIPNEKYKNYYRYSISEHAYTFEVYGNYLLVGIGNKKKIKKYGWVNITNVKYAN